MSLKEIRNGEENVYADEEKLTLSKWGKILWITPDAISRAAKRARIELEVRAPISPNGPASKLIPVSKFPRIIKGLQQARTAYHKGRPSHKWTQGVDVYNDFEVRPPSEATLIFSHDMPA